MPKAAGVKENVQTSAIWMDPGEFNWCQTHGRESSRLLPTLSNNL